MQNGFLGITVSSEQVGWAVTNPKYELERASRKDLWGVRLFDKAETAACVTGTGCTIAASYYICSTVVKKN